NGFDINRDNLFQTQPETINMTQVIEEWNPITFFENHGFVSGFQVEPCTPPHEPNFEYDLYAKYAVLAGEAFGAGAIANNASYNSYQMPLRDYMSVNSEGKTYWKNIWDDMSTNYTPQYSMLHGTLAYTVEIPAANEDGAKAFEYGMLAHSKFVSENKVDLLKNQLEFYRRGVKNEDVEATRAYYVNYNDDAYAEADIFRPKYEENGKFFPEYYVIPIDSDSQKNKPAAVEMYEHLLRNGVILNRLSKDTTVTDAYGDERTFKAGSVVVNMSQARRNVANGALYDGVVIDGWPDLYSEPITAFGKTRGFDCYAVTKAGAFDDAINDEITRANVPQASSEYKGDDDAKAVVLRNNGKDAVRAVNFSLDNGYDIAIVTKGEFEGDFVTSKETFDLLKNKFPLYATGLSVRLEAKAIEKPVLYVPGKTAEFATLNGKNYGVSNYGEYANLNRNFEIFALRDLGFTVADDLQDATVIFGSAALSASALEKVKSGTPYVVAGASPSTVRAAMPGVQTNVNGVQLSDALYYAEYLGDTLITAPYERDGDNIIYGYGGIAFTALPEGAAPIIKASDKELLEGFFPAESLKTFKGSVQAFEYKENGMDVTAFANSLVRKAHQQDEYRLLSNAIYSKSLGDEVGSGPSSAELENIFVNGEPISGFSVETRDYTYYIDPGSEQDFVVSASARGTDFSVTTTRMTSVPGVAYVTIADGGGSATYNVKFEYSAETPTELTGLEAENGTVVAVMSMAEGSNFTSEDFSAIISIDNAAPAPLTLNLLSVEGNRVKFAFQPEEASFADDKIVKIVVTYKGGAPVSASYTLPKSGGGVTGVQVLSARIVTVKASSRTKISARVLPEDNAAERMVWSSSNERVATVDAEGNVRSLSKGVAIITVDTANGGHAEQVVIRVI
ncbi:MAG: Ig-like domain-containing protein, partial [Clostridiales bacterium]|nr:Ig-like domain-containing protein [Clostridiales bacterium]